MDMDRYNRIIDLQDDAAATQGAGMHLIAYYCDGAAKALLRGNCRVSDDYLKEALVVVTQIKLLKLRRKQPREVSYYETMMATDRGY